MREVEEYWLPLGFDLEGDQQDQKAEKVRKSLVINKFKIFCPINKTYPNNWMIALVNLLEKINFIRHPRVLIQCG